MYQRERTSWLHLSPKCFGPCSLHWRNGERGMLWLIRVIRTCHNLRTHHYRKPFSIFLDSPPPSLPPPSSQHLLLPSGANMKHCVLRLLPCMCIVSFVTTVISNWRLSVSLSFSCARTLSSLFLSSHPVVLSFSLWCVRAHVRSCVCMCLCVWEREEMPCIYICAYFFLMYECKYNVKSFFSDYTSTERERAYTRTRHACMQAHTCTHENTHAHTIYPDT